MLYVSISQGCRYGSAHLQAVVDQEADCAVIPPLGADDIGLLRVAVGKSGSATASAL
jgi:hypothetical protein